MMATYSTEPPREEIEIKLKAGIARTVVFESSGNPGTPWKPVEWPGANQVLVQRKACVRGDKVTRMTFVGALHEMSPKSPEVIDAVVKTDSGVGWAAVTSQPSDAGVSGAISREGNW